MISNLKSTLRLGDTPRLALVGAGGKTTALFHLAREYGSPVIVANTAHMEIWQLALADRHFYCLDSQMPRLPEQMSGVTLLTGARNSRSVAGLGAAHIQSVLTLANEKQMPLLIEADGSRRHPVKAPADHEPPIPEFVDIVVVTVGLSALGRALTNEWVHRAKIFSALSGSPDGSPISIETVRRVLCHPSGGLKNIHKDSRRVVLLNQADTPYLRIKAGIMASDLLKTYQAVIVTTLLKKGELAHGDNPIQAMRRIMPEIHAVYQPVAGIILADCDSSSMDQPKLLRTHQGEPFIRSMANTALEAGLSPVLIVTGGYNDHEINAALENLQVQIISNPDWKASQSSSVRAGIWALPGQTSAAVIFTGDQPYIPPGSLRVLVETHAQTQLPVIALRNAEKGFNPVLFDRKMFPDLLELFDDTGMHQIFERYPPHYVIWED